MSPLTMNLTWTYLSYLQQTVNPDQFLVYKVIAPTHAVVTDVLVKIMTSWTLKLWNV